MQRKAEIGSSSPSFKLTVIYNTSFSSVQFSHPVVSDSSLNGQKSKIFFEIAKKMKRPVLPQGILQAKEPSWLQSMGSQSRTRLKRLSTRMCPKGAVVWQDGAPWEGDWTGMSSWALPRYSPDSSTLVMQVWITFYCLSNRASLITQLVKNLPAMQETLVWFLGQEDSLENG